MTSSGHKSVHKINKSINKVIQNTTVWLQQRILLRNFRQLTVVVHQLFCPTRHLASTITGVVMWSHVRSSGIV